MARGPEFDTPGVGHMYFYIFFFLQIHISIYFFLINQVFKIYRYVFKISLATRYQIGGKPNQCVFQISLDIGTNLLVPVVGTPFY